MSSNKNWHLYKKQFKYATGSTVHGIEKVKVTDEKEDQKKVEK